VPFHQLVIDLGRADPGPAEQACLALGAIAVSLTDGGDHPVLEPGPGEMPLWPELRLLALFGQATDPRMLAAVLTAVLGLPERSIRVEELADRPWEREWLKDFRPMRFGRRLWVCPGGQGAPAADAVVLELDPGLAFGTGTHATTALCLEWLDGLTLAGRSVLDYGCGSGILALAALRLGAFAATAFDIDAQALLATRENAKRNRLEGGLTIAADTASICGPFDVALANILAGPLVGLAPALARHCAPGGDIALAGILDAQAPEVAQAYGPWFDIGPAARRDGWTMLAGRRRGE